MKYRGLVLSLSALLLVSAASSLAFVAPRGGPERVHATPDGMDAMIIDMDPEDAPQGAPFTPVNNDSSFGDIQECARIDNDGILNQDEDATADRLRFDVLAQGIPAATAMLAFQAKINHDDSNLTVVAPVQSASPGVSMVARDGNFNESSANQPLPDVTIDGTYGVSATDQSADPLEAEAGDGVLARIPIEADGADGVYTLTLDPANSYHLDVNGALGGTHYPNALVNARISVGQACPAPQADLAVLSTPSTTAPAGGTVGAPFNVSVNGTIINNGPSSASGTATLTLAVPGDCTRTPNNDQTQAVPTLAASSTALVSKTWSVTCTQPSNHVFNGTVAIAVGGIDPTPGNDGPVNATPATTVIAEASADLKVFSVSASSPPSVPQGSAFAVTVNAILHNNGPDPAPADPTVTLSLPGGCSTSNNPRALAQQVLAVSVGAAIPTQTFTVICSLAALATFGAVVDVAAPSFVIDGTPGNNSASSQTITDVFADDDGDGVVNANDTCPGTSGAPVDPNGCSQAQVDQDLDGICDPGGASTLCTGSDNCPATPNPGQENLDADSEGDACDSDVDGDTVPNATDNCPVTANPLQENSVHAGTALGDACDDPDVDAVFDITDNCPDAPNAGQENAVHPASMVGDACEDPDSDGVYDIVDNCADAPNSDQVNTDTVVNWPGDSMGDACDPDDDNDGYSDIAEADSAGNPAGNLLPSNSLSPYSVPETCDGADNDLNEGADEGYTNTDGDSLADCVDPDDDNDGVLDSTDNCPVTANSSQENLDGDGAGDACDPDDDNDTVADGVDNCPRDLNPAQTDTDGDGLGNECDANDDGDGLPDMSDPCPQIAEDYDGFEDADGCPEGDNDGDGICDPWYTPSLPVCSGADSCPNQMEDLDSYKDTNGCPDSDNDGDGFADGSDQCAGTDFTAGPDGIADSGDEPLAPLPTLTKEDYDGVIDTDGCHDSPGDDFDGDGLSDEEEVFLFLTNPQNVDTDGESYPDGVEIVCGSNPISPSSGPERVDASFAGADDDGDTQVDEALPAGASAYDCDGDGYAGSGENHVYGPSARGDQDPCGSNGWPADLAAGSSANRVDISDIVSFLTPTYYLFTTAGTNPGDVRWDLWPDNSLNIADIANLVTLAPPMLDGQPAMLGPQCPWLP